MKMIDGAVSIVRTDGAEVYIEHRELVTCQHCSHYDTHDHRCKVWNHGVAKDGWCDRGGRKEE